MMKKLLLFTIVSIAVYSPAVIATPHSIPDPEAVRAYKHYWNTFDRYEERRISDTKNSVSQAWDELRQEFNHEKRVLTGEQIAQLKNAADSYRNHLANHPNAANKPYVLLNLAQILNKLADHQTEVDPGSGTIYQSEALSTLTEIIDNYRRFEKIEETFYLKATILDAMEQKKSAHKVWSYLAKIAKNSIYGAHAQIAMGDYFFRKESSQESLRRYKRALDIISKIRIADKDYEMVRVQYRIAWAAYRSAELGLCISTAIRLLQPGRVMRQVSIKRAIEKDAMELIGDALYENNNMIYTKSILGRRVLRNYASGIALRGLKRYIAGNISSNIAELGEFIVETYPRSKHLPDILTILADSYSKTKQWELRLEALEKLALLLPRKSLWRTEYRNDYPTIKNMEQKAYSANIVLASYYYKLGMTNANVSAFAAASSYYKTLLNYNGNHQNANDWRLKQANSYYFSSKLGHAKKIYTDLIKNQKVTRKNLQVASYQVVLTYEKIWRKEFGASLQARRDPTKDPIVMQHVVDLESSVDSFANRFPQSQFAIEALLKAAAANRDMERMHQANKYWQRVLVSNPKSNERSLAIRGLIFDKVKNGSYQQVIEIASRYLRLEDWRALGKGLRLEVEGILMSAIQTGSDELNAKGEVLAAARLLQKMATDFPYLTNHDTMVRDSAYMMAIGGEWRQALLISQKALDTKKFRHKGDMAYLKARSLEFQMRFKLASKAYLEMAQKHRRHSRTIVSLKRAIFLADAEEDLKTKAKATEMLASFTKKKPEKRRLYLAAADSYEDNKNYDAALRAARKAKSLSKSIEDRLESRLVMAKQRFQLGEEVVALKEYRKIAKDTKRYQGRMDRAKFSRFYSESNFLLAEEERAIFEDFGITERSGSIANNVKEKTRYFENLSRYYQKSVQGNAPQFTVRARYQIGASAEALSQEINDIAMTNSSLSHATKTRFQQQASRLKKLAANYFSENLVENRRRPKIHHNNPWLKKSAIKLIGFPDSRQIDMDSQNLPYSTSNLMPHQWSL